MGTSKRKVASSNTVEDNIAPVAHVRAGTNARYGDDVREQAIALYAVDGNITRTAKTLGLAKSTVYKWINAPEWCEQVKRMRTEKRIEFADKASEIIDKGLLLVERRITTALEHECELEHIISQIASENMSHAEKQMLIVKIKALELQKLGDITTAIGTLFDKRALARGESTTNNSITITLDGELSEWAK